MAFASEALLPCPLCSWKSYEFTGFVFPKIDKVFATKTGPPPRLSLICPDCGWSAHTEFPTGSDADELVVGLNEFWNGQQRERFSKAVKPFRKIEQIHLERYGPI